MKRTKSIALFLTALLSFIVGCGTALAPKVITIDDVDSEELARTAARNTATGYYLVYYGTTNVPVITSCKKDGENHYTVYGKMTLTDNYGDKYTGKWSCGVTYDPNKAEEILRENTITEKDIDEKGWYEYFKDAIDTDRGADWGVPYKD